MINKVTEKHINITLEKNGDTDEKLLVVQIEPEFTYLIDEIKIITDEFSPAVTIYSEMWKSKYNSYVQYDYKPFCSDGFMFVLKLRGNGNTFEFCKKLLEDRINTILKLETLLV